MRSQAQAIIPMEDAAIPIDQAAIIMSLGTDRVAIAKRRIAAGTTLRLADGSVVTPTADIERAHRFALCAIPEGEYLTQSGYPFARSKGIAAGEAVTPHNTEAAIPEAAFSTLVPPPPTGLRPELAARTFQGYRRGNGAVGTRNLYLVVPTSMCASETARLIAARLESRVAEAFPGMDGIVAIPHTEGCGCAANGQIDRLLTVLGGFVGHANVGGCLIVDLGCEQTDRRVVSGALAEVMAACDKPVDWLTIQQEGGIRATIEKGERVVMERLPQVSRASREACPISSLVIGTECGASDAFSGISANPLIGAAADMIVHAGGRAIMSEIPEMLGTYGMLLPRFRSEEVAGKFQQAVSWYLELAQKLGLDISDNLVPKNIAGGLINSYLKSLGAVLKGGSSAIEDVIGYGEPAAKAGLSVMQGPGGDLESVTGLVASGANIVCFSTGYGAVTGSAICPVVKISSTTETCRNLPDVIDFDAGVLLGNEATLDRLSERLLDRVVAVASGARTCTELAQQRQFQVWSAGKLSL